MWVGLLANSGYMGEVPIFPFFGHMGGTSSRGIAQASLNSLLVPIGSIVSVTSDLKGEQNVVGDGTRA